MAALAIPRLSGFTTTAKNQAGEANAKLLTTTYQLVIADGQTAPTTVQEIIDAVDTNNVKYIADGTDITAASYTLNNGVVTFTEGQEP